MTMTNAAPITTEELNGRIQSLEVNIKKLQSSSTDEELANELTCIKIGIYILIATVFIIAFVAAAVLLKVLRVPPKQKNTLTQKTCQPQINHYSTGNTLKEKDNHIGRDLPSDGGYEKPLNREENNYEMMPPARTSLMNPCYEGVNSEGVYEELPDVDKKPNYERINSTEDYQEIIHPGGEGCKNIFENFY